MKRAKVISLGIVSGLLLVGCAQRELVFTQNSICQSPVAEIYLQGVFQRNNQGTISEGEFRNLLEEVMQNTGCIHLLKKPQQGAYTLNAAYEIKMENTKSKETFKSKSNHTLQTRVVLTLNNQEVIRRDFGESKISTEENKVLGIGEDETISKDDEEKALKSSILAALKNFISEIDSQETSSQNEQSQE
ncbi:hypothetical protein [Helicobacter kayseriensis]|uniref:hypothetical protein n=1 Tax=Helicobacter kayseriensis TaxID=2905877 RepID=UPI001E59F132|nr:hypothetical protein [Helicobacter kayseriensis]MCE3046791.1 hypothetical protein [Helicobacter kayseriensis]MCE3047907.1 hypothetical protein [Helicobacter kayseriensis]